MPELSIEAEVEFAVECSECGEPLNATVQSWGETPTVVVAPCETCLEQAKV